MKGIVFLDLLGFSVLTNQNEPNAFLKINYIKDYIKTRWIDTEVINKFYGEKNILGFVNNIEYAMTISDSLIVSGDSSSYSFWVDLCFLIFDILSESMEEGLSKGDYSFACLLRGGSSVSEGDVIFESNSIINHALEKTYSVFGKDYIKAYQNESVAKGPSIIISKEDYEKLPEKSRTTFIVYSNNEYYELLWPAICFYKHNLVIEKNPDLGTMFDTTYRKFLKNAKDICEHYIGSKEYEHYRQFASLIHKSLVYLKSLYSGACDIKMIDSYIDVFAKLVIDLNEGKLS